MRPLETKGRKALNKAYLKVKLGREEIEAFKGHLLTLLGNLAAKGHEGQQKTLVATFLRDAFYKDSHQVNEKDKIDLAIFTGKTVKDPVGVIIEAKSTKNAGEMFGATNLGAKSMCELVLYYLRERVDADNHDLRHMVITNGYDWYIFDRNNQVGQAAALESFKQHRPIWPLLHTCQARSLGRSGQDGVGRMRTAFKVCLK